MDTPDSTRDSFDTAEDTQLSKDLRKLAHMALAGLVLAVEAGLFVGVLAYLTR